MFKRNCIHTVWTKCEFKHKNFGSLLKNTLKLIPVWNLAWDIHVPVYGSGARVEVPVNIEQSHIFQFAVLNTAILSQGFFTVFPVSL